MARLPIFRPRLNWLDLLGLQIPMSLPFVDEACVFYVRVEPYSLQSSGKRNSVEQWIFTATSLIRCLETVTR